MQLQELIPYIVGSDSLHVKWLNTLSFMENCGARKISASEDTILTNYIVLKHAAEEHRHAFYLKAQIRKLIPDACKNYSREFLLAPIASYQYLHALDTQVSKMVKHKLGKRGSELKFLAYLFVTYAIEVRADELYPIYQAELEKVQSPISVQSIILEEEGHLEEMIAQLEEFSPNWKEYAHEATIIEAELYSEWLEGLAQEVRAELIA